MLRRETIMVEIVDTQKSIELLKEQVQLKEVYLESLKKKKKELDEVERMG
ncbi:MAG: hypothetical protein PHN69_07455 [Candidatus Pacebacteria bacterium]|nr:hypothetical protein [Candidatus Paceibacterota bacterium]